MLDEGILKFIQVLSQWLLTRMADFQSVEEPTDRGCRGFPVQYCQLFFCLALPRGKLAHDLLQAFMKIGNGLLQGLLTLRRKVLKIFGAECLGFLIDGCKSEIGGRFNQGNLLCLCLCAQGIDSRCLPVIDGLFDGFCLLAIALDFKRCRYGGRQCFNELVDVIGKAFTLSGRHTKRPWLAWVLEVMDIAPVIRHGSSP